MKIAMLPWSTAGLVLGFIVFQVVDNLCLRVAAERTGWNALLFFAVGNVMGFCGTILLTLSLRGQNPNIMFALGYGLGFCALQLASYFFFRIPLSSPQWVGVALIAAGVVCLQLRG